MAILGLQGLRGGTGTTSLTAALGWALQSLGEKVIIVDACPDNMLRYFFNDNIANRDGWARALLDGKDWRDAGLRYTSHIDFLPFGQLSVTERVNVQVLTPVLNQAVDIVQALDQQRPHHWVLIDLPHDVQPWMQPLIEACNHMLTVTNPDANAHIRLHQQVLPKHGHILINDLRIGSHVQDDIYRVWLQSQPRMLPVIIHRDESVAECLAAKQPLGEYRSDSLAAEEVVTLANWCLMHYAGISPGAEQPS
ncbi:cellulose biosynthesis protein BcsQ [Scandinavium goeteborgense]|uniref:cellulose biosynthesis protein BcsQ n=1 Tax=Scandinavium goeteborgense TaxID=1851514 RepID=UPI002166A4D0|nr:cellulose biosynthesis protein BcsQ [Scandinavium goeteborgense]MCS2151668.1 cellulose biosynthesis protein BcsQ [Scandinavium goeteborgense]